MKKYFIITFLIALALNVKAVERPCWIAPQGNTDTVSTWLCYQKTVDLKKVPRRAMTRISADSKYWLWINGEPVVIEGGVKRGPNPHDSYCDNIDLAPFLKKGRMWFLFWSGILANMVSHTILRARLHCLLTAPSFRNLTVTAAGTV